MWIDAAVAAVLARTARAHAIEHGWAPKPNVAAPVVTLTETRSETHHLSNAGF
ncbi:hypothetical protein [Micromonospora tarensis]|uniref:Uncharacterized protein n=1 Tax=Micromonospora tarensis TaxID=2806100 RepID=A0ABS1YK98_9ACTN|nr:hypothetical protein [Micromonospora tarensis]MBM0277821.1 hypothetical protein [Micromonospora tarensis]